MAGVKLLVPVLLVAVVAIVLVVYYPSWQPWAAVHTGAAGGQEAGGAYAYWSGFGSVFPWSMGVLAGVFAFGYQHSKRANCHTHGCWRIGSYPVGNYKVCKRCHHLVKDTHPTIEHLKSVHSSLEVADNQCEARAPGTPGT